MQPNIRGSSGYGQKFMASTKGDWGFGDYKDIMAGVDDLIRRKIADPNRLGIGGWSYGGYMAEWAITQTDRFKVAICGAGLADPATEFGTEGDRKATSGIFPRLTRIWPVFRNRRRSYTSRTPRRRR